MRLIVAGQAWVACDATDTPVGMVIASVRGYPAVTLSTLPRQAPLRYPH